MIRKIKFSNFYSFNETQEISFLTNKKKSYDYYNSKKDGEQITKVAGFVGGNASGKTNIMRLFGFLSYFVCGDRGVFGDINFKNFFDNKEKSTFYVEFEFEKNIYFYEFEIKDKKIIKESLSFVDISSVENGNKIKKMKKNVFDRFFVDGSKKIKLNNTFFKNIDNEYFDAMKDSFSLIYFIKTSKYNIDIINKIFDYFSKIYTNTNERGELNGVAHKLVSFDIYLNNDDLKLQSEEFIRRFGIDNNFKKFEIQKVIEGNAFRYNIFGVHNLNNEDKKLDFWYESRGTQELFCMFAYISSALKNNSVVIIDEIETGLHPEAVNKIINYFIDENENGNAQLIFSSHSLEFMRKFDMQQIFLVDKDKKLNSFAYRLDEVDGVRPDENFLSKYMSGAYGAFPDIKV